MKILHRFSGRRAVGFGKEHVKSDSGALPLKELVKQLRHKRPRPGPLAIGLQACFININDHHGTADIHARFRGLKQIKASEFEFL